MGSNLDVSFVRLSIDASVKTLEHWRGMLPRLSRTFGNRRKNFVFLVCCVLAVTLAAAVYHCIKTLLWANDQKTSVLRQGTFSGTLGLFIGEETGLRGFDVTGERQFLEPYRQAQQPLEDRLLQMQIVANKSQDARARAIVGDLRRLHSRWLRDVARPIILRGGLRRDVGQEELGKRYMDAIRADLDTLQVVVSRIAASRDSEFRDAIWELGVIAAFILTATAVLVARTIRDAAMVKIIANASPSAIVMVDASGIITFFNAKADALFGYMRGELVGRPIGTLIPERFRAGHPELRAAFQIAPSARSMGAGRDLYARRKDGSEIPVEIGLNPLKVSGRSFTLAAVMDVSERHIAEEYRLTAMTRLSEANRLMTMAEQVSHVGHWRLDTDSQKVYWSDEMYRIFGLPMTFEPTAENSMMLYHPEDRAEARATAVLAASKGIQYTRATRAVRPDGTIRHILVKGQPEYGPDGSICSVYGVLQVVTEEKVRETERASMLASLADSNHLMKMAEEMAQYGHWRVDLKTNKVFWSEELYRILGQPADLHPTLEQAIALHDAGWVDVGAIVRQASIDGEPFSYETRIRRPDDDFRDVLCRGRGEFSAAGDLVALVGVFRDISVRKNAERVRDLLAEHVSIATKTGGTGVWEWMVQTGTMTWLGQMFSLYGLDAATTVPSYQLWRESLDDRDRDRAERGIADALIGDAPLDIEFRVVWPNKEIHSLRAQATVLRDADGEPIRMVGINWDITEVRSLSDQMSSVREASILTERERLYEHERKWSRAFQQAVLPRALPEVSGCSFDAVYEPGKGDAQVGGDWYDAALLPDGRIFVSIGDVFGSGLQAAVVVGVARQIMRGISQLYADPTLILDAADRALSQEYPGVYVSAWVGVIDLVTRTIAYASAGHPAPLLISKDGLVRELEDPTSLLIGLRKGHRGQANTARLSQGDTLILYTDGVTEAGHDLLAGSTSLLEAVGSAGLSTHPHPAGYIKHRAIPGGSPDDVAIMVVRTDYTAAERYIERWIFDVRDGDAASVARGKFVECLRAQEFTADARAGAELVFGELVGNVLRHANATSDVEIAVNHGGVDTVLHVMDQGNGFNHISRLPRDPYAENGRGLFLIAALTQDFTVSERPDGGSHARAVLAKA